MAKMENNEAIEVLERHSQEFACDHGWNYSVLEALQMGIEALKTEQVTWIVGNNNAQVAVKNMPVDKMKKICAIIGDEQTQTECEDAISRNAVLDTINEYPWSDIFVSYDVYSALFDFIEELPSVNPILKESPESFNKDSETESMLNADLISRQAAICLIDDWKEAFIESRHLESAGDISLVKNDLTKLPPVTRQKVGRWGRKIVDGGYNADWICSECGYKEMTDFPTKFCPNCGAKMEEGDK